MNIRQKNIKIIFSVFIYFIVAPLSVLADVADCTVVKTGEAQKVSFKSKAKDGTKVEVEGILMKPDGKGPFPGMVLLHGHGGLYPPRCYEGAIRLFVEFGYVSLMIDTDSRERPSGMMNEYTSEDQAQDAYKGIEFLAALPYVLSDKIGVIGWSLGGAAAIESVSNNRRTFVMDKKAPFSAAAAIYPICYKKIKDLEAPLLILIGEADVRTPAAVCRAMQVTKKDDVEYNLIVYPNAGHGYDSRHSWYYDQAASEDTMKRLKEFFAKYLKR